MILGFIIESYCYVKFKIYEKKIFKLLSIITLSLFVLGCEEELKIFDAENGQTAISFSRSSLTIGNCDPQAEIVLQSTTKSNVDRTYNISVSADGTTGTSDQYSVPSSITIPAGEFVGTATVAIDFDQVEAGVAEAVVLDVNLPSDEVINARGKITVNYTGVCLLNEIELSFIFDQYPEETAWVIFDAATGDVIASTERFQYGVYAGLSNFRQTFCLPSGDYILSVRDRFADGICCSYGNGSFTVSTLTCEGKTTVLTGGEFGGRIDVPFTL